MDDTIDPTFTPFSGPRGDYAGAARKAEYASAHRAVYTGYKKLHGIKVETVVLPNGLTTLFGPVSARQSGPGVEEMSNINAFLVHLQRHLFVCAAGWGHYGVFGDGAFSLDRECIQSYYRSFSAAVPLTQAQRRVNNSMKSARIVIEKNYRALANKFHICDMKPGMKLSKTNPYAIEHLQVCHLLLNYQICFNNDQAGSSNAFGVSPPRVEDYLCL